MPISSETSSTPDEHDKRDTVRRLLSRMGGSTALLLLPLYLFATFYFLRWLEPRALATYSFLVGGPIIISLLLSRGAPKGALLSFFSTSLVLLAFSTAIYWADLEAGICFIVLLLPFVVVGALVSLVSSTRRFREITKVLSKTGPSAILLLFVPLGALLEKSVLETTSVNSTTSTVQVSAAPHEVWGGIVEVGTLSEGEIPPTLLTYLDVPRPVRSVLERRGNETLRVGYFENGLRFLERLETLRPPHELRLSVTPDESSLITDDAVRHAFSQGYLEIQEVRYHLEPTHQGTTLTLSCRYSLTTSANWYAQLVAKLVLAEFQENLLQALLNRFERKVVPDSPLLLANKP